MRKIQPPSRREIKEFSKAAIQVWTLAEIFQGFKQGKFNGAATEVQLAVLIIVVLLVAHKQIIAIIKAIDIPKLAKVINRLWKK